MTLLMGKALDWATAVWERDMQLQTSFDYFVSQLHKIFEYPEGGKNISVQLLHLHQGSRSAADYGIEFRKLAAQSGWNDVALKTIRRTQSQPAGRTGI